MRHILKNLVFISIIALPPLIAQAGGVAVSNAPMKLEQLISSALSSHPAAQVQRALEQSARAGVDSANWQYYPTPSVTIEGVNSNGSDPIYQGDGAVTTLRLQQPLWTGGRLSAGVDKAKAEVSASQASLEESRQQIALRVVQTYGDWLSAHLQLQAYEKSIAIHERLREQVRRRIAQGASADSDLTLAMSRLQSIAAEISVVRAQKEVALARLGQLLGRPITEAEFGTAHAAPRRVTSGLPKLLQQAQDINPSLQRAQAQAAVQEAVIIERRADLQPEVYLRAERQYGNYTFANARPDTRIFIGVNSRFGAGLSSLSNVDGAKAQHRAALAEIEVQSRAINEQVAADYALAISLGSRLMAIDAALDASKQVSESFDRQFLAGRKSWLDVMNAARELEQIEVQRGEVLSTQVIASWRLAINTQALTALLDGAK